MLGSMVGTGDTGEKKVVCALSVLGHLDVLGILAHLKKVHRLCTHIGRHLIRLEEFSRAEDPGDEF